MARPLRIEYPGAFYHVLNRGLEYRDIFKDNSDFEYFVSLFEDVFDKYKIRAHSYCLMPNHYHLYLETPKGQLSKIMRHLDGVYTQRFNKKYKRVGPLMQGRYKAILVDKESYSLEISRYIHLNPIKAKLVKNPEDWNWSSYKIFIGKSKKEKYMETHWLLSQFSKRLKRARTLFKEFTQEGIKKDWSPQQENIKGGILGENDFIEWIRDKILTGKHDPEIPQLKEFKKEINEEKLEGFINKMTTDTSLQRKLKVYALKKYSSLSLREIGMRAGGLKYPSISLMVRRLEEETQGNRYVNNLISKINDYCKM